MVHSVACKVVDPTEGHQGVDLVLQKWMTMISQTCLGDPSSSLMLPGFRDDIARWMVFYREWRRFVGDAGVCALGD